MPVMDIRGSPLGGLRCRVAERDNDRRPAAHERIGRPLESTVVAPRVPAFDHDIAAFDVAMLAQSFDEGLPVAIRLVECKDADARRLYRRLRLYAADEQRDDTQRQRRRVPPSRTVFRVGVHSITLSARVRSVSGTLSPSSRAVARLTENISRVGCSIGSSAGLAPLRILSTYTAG
jgi:hypothetical protein